MCIIINHGRQGEKGEQNEGSLKTCHPQTYMLDADWRQKPNWPNPERNIGSAFSCSDCSPQVGIVTNWEADVPFKVLDFRDETASLQNKNGWVLPGMSFSLSQWPTRQARMLILLVETNLPELQTAFSTDAPLEVLIRQSLWFHLIGMSFSPRISSGGGYHEAWNRETWDGERFVCG
jgi:hypothetical protein